jgi:hypothetical protein
MLNVNISLNEARRKVADNLDNHVRKLSAEAVDARTVTGVRHDDRKRLRGLPCIAKRTSGVVTDSFIPGSDEHLDSMLE